MKTSTLSVYALVILLAGCNADLNIREISSLATPGATIDGVPFRTKKSTTATVWQRKDDGSYESVSEKPFPMTIADQDHLYVLGYRGKMLSDATLDVSLDKDNTLLKVNLASTSKAADAATNSATAMQGITTQIQTEKTSKATKATAEQTALLTADAANAKAEEVLLAYQLAQQDPTVSATDLLAKKDALRAAQLAANEAARLAGLPPYYPGVTPYKL